MLTYNKTVAMPRLVIEYDEWAKSPRELNDNIGYFFTKESRHISPDGKDHILYQIILDTEDEAKNANDHIKRIKKQAHTAFLESCPNIDGNSHNEELHIIDIYPIYRYEHGNVIYRRGTVQGFNYSNCGFYFVTAKGLDKGTYTTEKIKKIIDAELAEYSQWCNGEVFCFTLYGENGEIENSGGNFYDIEDIREYLSEEWKNEKLEDYLK